jgi:hypothetical protein
MQSHFRFDIDGARVTIVGTDLLVVSAPNLLRNLADYLEAIAQRDNPEGYAIAQQLHQHAQSLVKAKQD